jgi:hypothetical protein
MQNDLSMRMVEKQSQKREEDFVVIRENPVILPSGSIKALNNQESSSIKKLKR